MSYEESWNNSLNKYLAIMDTRTDDIPDLVEKILGEGELSLPGCVCTHEEIKKVMEGNDE